MPSRIIRESAPTSESLDRLGWSSRADIRRSAGGKEAWLSYSQ
jgi:hypothetical protein